MKNFLKILPNNFCLFILGLIIYGHYNYLQAQTLNELEQQFLVAKKESLTAYNKLDSLKSVLNARAELIDRTKRNPSKSEDEILVLMANSVSISNEYRLQEQRARSWDDKVENLKVLLSKKYTQIIDSLRTIRSSGKRNIGNEDWDRLILQFTEKKLLVAPQITSLSLSPEKLIKIDVTKSKDPIERRIVKEYLTNAMTEVNTYLKQIEEENYEIAEITLLQTKTRQFLEETDFANEVRPITIVTEGNNATDVSGGIFGETEMRGETVLRTGQIIVPQLETYSKIMNQLSFIGSPAGTDRKTTLETAKSNLSLEEYRKFLNELENRLKEYKFILENKAATIND